MSVRELADAIGMRPSALYHHLSALRRVGLVVEAGSRLASRRREALLATPSPRMRLRRALSDPTLRGLMRDVVAGLCRQMERDFARGLDSGTGQPEGPRRNLGFFRLVGRPSARQLAQLNARLDEVAEILWHSRDPEAPLLALGWTLAPIRSSARRVRSATHRSLTPPPRKGSK